MIRAASRAGLLEPVLGLTARLRGDLLGRIVRSLQDPRDLLADALQRAPDRGLGRPRRLQFGDQLAGLLDIGVDRDAVIAAQRHREVDVCRERHRIVWQRRQRRGDLLDDGVLRGS